jgi:hypothetical protein
MYYRSAVINTYAEGRIMTPHLVQYRTEAYLKNGLALSTELSLSEIFGLSAAQSGSMTMRYIPVGVIFQRLPQERTKLTG